MPKSAERFEQLSPQEAQANYYESSVKWVLSLKKRHDLYNLIQILDNDIEHYPFLDIDTALLPAYKPTEKEIFTEGRLALERPILHELRMDGNLVLGDGYYDKFVDDLLGVQNNTGDSESMLKTVWGRMQTRNQNIAAIAYHPNIMALPACSGALALAMSRSEALKDDFDLFDFTEHNLLLINPALCVASFRGKPIAERLQMFSTAIKIPPPTTSSFLYDMNRTVQKQLSYNGKEALNAYLKNATDHNKSVLVTVDPTASTFETTVDESGEKVLRRKPVNPLLQSLILTKFDFAWPMTLLLKGQSSAWHIGNATPLRGDETGADFERMIDMLDRQTESLAGMRMTVGNGERSLGRTALSNSSV